MEWNQFSLESGLEFSLKTKKEKAQNLYIKLLYARVFLTFRYGDQSVYAVYYPRAI